MNEYKSRNDIDQSLKRLTLERQIALEELKGVRHEVKENLKPYNWLNSILSVGKKYGMLYVIRRILK